MDSLQYVLPFVLTSVVIGLGVGYYMGWARRHLRDHEHIKKERDASVKVLTGLLSTAEELTADVDSHNSEIRQVGQDVVDTATDGELSAFQKKFLRQIASVLESNRKLEEDLTYARYRMEEQAQEIDRTRKEARTDALSGIANRKAFDEKLEMCMRDWRKHSTPFVLILADIDHFKWINDTHGHQAGDLVVSNLGEFLRKFLREVDFIARYGGDEFAILITGCEIKRGSDIAERIRTQVASVVFDVNNDERASVTFSIGVASPEPEDDSKRIIEKADHAMYRSKEVGRNKVHVFEEAASERAYMLASS